MHLCIKRKTKQTHAYIWKKEISVGLIIKNYKFISRVQKHKIISNKISNAAFVFLYDRKYYLLKDIYFRNFYWFLEECIITEMSFSKLCPTTKIKWIFCFSFFKGNITCLIFRNLTFLVSFSTWLFIYPEMHGFRVNSVLLDAALVGSVATTGGSSEIGVV